MKGIRSLSFWKRNPNSVESVYRLTLKPSQDGYTMVTSDENGEKKRNLSTNEVNSLLNLLFVSYDLDHTEDQYKAYKYENNPNDFNLKFFLEIDFKDYTYLCIKGLHPFKQPHFKEIMDTFSPLIEGK